MNWMERLHARVGRKHLLDHPFYQRWSAGQLSLGELQEYARQYYHYSLAFPTFLSGIHSNCDDLAIRQAVLENLIEEERGPENHPELWLRFCEALGLTREEVIGSRASQKTRDLIDVMRALTRDGDVHEGLAALYAYESQVPAVARTKIDGLAKHYSIDDEEAIRFFSVHLEADVLHAKTSEDLLTQLCVNDEKRDEATEALETTLEALYGFLDGVNLETPAMVN
ncbi:MAG TPA: CADD family putative folate metabolism protein [Thermoanaerobaculia bacterium]